MSKIIGEMGNVKSLNFGPKPGGFNVLNVPDELYLNAEQFWTEYNRPWLDAALQRGDHFIYATKPKMDVLRSIDPITQQRRLTGLGKEYLHMRKNGAPSALEY